MNSLDVEFSPLDMLHTPRVLGTSMLDACLGGRRTLADSLASGLSSGFEDGTGSHVVIDGGPGSGKSHLLECLVRRAEGRDDEARPLVARADAGGVRRLLDLGLRWVSDLAARRGDPQIVGRRLALAKLPAGAATQASLGLVGELAGEGPLLLVIEGIDEVVGRVGWEAWGRFEHVLARRPRWMLLATARQPSTGRGREWIEIPDAETRVAHLDPLSAPQMGALAESVLGSCGASPAAVVAGQAGATAFSCLVGGSVRSWLAFLGALRRDPIHPERAFLVSLDRLMRDLDDAPLSPQQRLLVEELALAGAPRSVKELAAACYVTHQTATAQLGVLRAAGVVQAVRRGRRALYALTDPGLESVIRLRRGDAWALVESFLFLIASTTASAGADAPPSLAEELFQRTPELWRAGLEALVGEEGRDPAGRRALGVGLAATLPSLLDPSTPAEHSRLWRDLWWEWGGRFPELRPALGALAGAHRIREKGPAELPLLPRADRHLLRRSLASVRASRGSSRPAGG